MAWCRDGVHRDRHHHHVVKKYSSKRRYATNGRFRGRSDSRDGYSAMRQGRRAGSRRLSSRDRRGRDRERRGGRDHSWDRDRSRSRRKSRRDRRSREGRGGKRRTSRRSRHRNGKSSRSRRRNRDRRQRSRSSTAYSSSSSESRGSTSNDDEIVHFAWQKGQVLNSRYRVEKVLGDGTFGRVLGSYDQRENKDVAIKVIRDVKRYIENAKIEADILKAIRKADPQGSSSRSAIMSDTFMYEQHYCLVMEACGVSLYDFLKDNEFRGFWMQDIQSFAQQSLEALAFLRSQLQMTHTDLKPENILLEFAEPAQPAIFPRMERWQRKSGSKTREKTGYVRPANARIKLIDFGNATYESEHHSSIINTRQYRSPEVILSLGWNERSDIWSMGCIFMELYTGELLFGTHENLEHMHLMERILEPIPSSLLSSASDDVKEKFVKHNSRPCKLGALAAKSASYVRSQTQLKDMVEPHHIGFASFVGHLLTLDQARRPWAAEALDLPFLSKQYTD